MKKLLLFICTVSTCLLSYGQAKFYTSNGTREVTSLEVGMSDIKVTVPVPDQVANHTLVEIAIDYIANGEFQAGNFSYFKEYKSSYLSSQKEVSLWIKAPGKPDGDFCSQRYGFGCYKIEDDLNFTNRDYTSSTIEIRVIGKDVESWKWENDKQVPVYKYQTLTSSKIKMNYGEVEQAIYSDEKNIKLERFIGQNKVSISKGGRTMRMLYSSLGDVDTDNEAKANSVVFEVNTMEEGESVPSDGDMFGGGEPAQSEGSTSETLKKSVGYTFLFNSNSYDAERYIDGVSPVLAWGHYASSEDDAHFYEPFSLAAKQQGGGSKLTKLMGSNTQKIKQNYQNLLEEGLKGLSWEKGKVGNFDCEVLDVQVYTTEQVYEEGDPEMKKVKASEQGKTKRLLLFVGEQDGLVYYGHLFKAGRSALTAEEQKFWDHMLSTFEVL